MCVHWMGKMGLDFVLMDGQSGWRGRGEDE
jgi:hypothetical protein